MKDYIDAEFRKALANMQALAADAPLHADLQRAVEACVEALRSGGNLRRGNRGADRRLVGNRITQPDGLATVAQGLAQPIPSIKVTEALNAQRTSPNFVVLEDCFLWVRAA